MRAIPDELNRLVPRREIAFEIQPTFEIHGPANGKSAGGRIRLAALRNGKPIPDAVFTAIDSNLSEQTIKAGSDGTASWDPPAPGRYSVYTRETLKQPGTLGDKNYDEIREFATLALDWPLERHDADPEATALFKEAMTHRAQWRDFPGFSAQCSGQLDGRTFTGKVTVAKDGSVELETDYPPPSRGFRTSSTRWSCIASLSPKATRPTLGNRGYISPTKPTIIPWAACWRSTETRWARATGSRTARSPWSIAGWASNT